VRIIACTLKACGGRIARRQGDGVTEASALNKRFAADRVAREAFGRA